MLIFNRDLWKPKTDRMSANGEVRLASLEVMTFFVHIPSHTHTDICLEHNLESICSSKDGSRRSNKENNFSSDFIVFLSTVRRSQRGWSSHPAQKCISHTFAFRRNNGAKAFRPITANLSSASNTRPVSFNFPLTAQVAATAAANLDLNRALTSVFTVFSFMRLPGFDFYVVFSTSNCELLRGGEGEGVVKYVILRTALALNLVISCVKCI